MWCFLPSFSLSALGYDLAKLLYCGSKRFELRYIPNATTVQKVMNCGVLGEISSKGLVSLFPCLPTGFLQKGTTCRKRLCLFFLYAHPQQVNLR